MKKEFLLTAMVMLLIFPEHLSAARNKDYVVLLHGLGRTQFSMKLMEYSLVKQGYSVVNIGYPSTKYPIERLAKDIKNTIDRKCPDRSLKINFVTHSMGGIILRYMQDKTPIKNIGRAVMLSPPNNGSEIAEFLKNNKLFQIATGPAGQQLGTDKSSLPKNLGPVNFALAVITGDKNLNPLFSNIICAPNDGKVTVESAKVKGMKDFLIVHHTHTFIMNSPDVISQTIYFLENGRFQKKP